MSYFGEVFAGVRGLLKGMGVTLKNMFRKPVTLEYPHVEPELSTAFRSAIALIRFDETKTHDCVACMQCVNICPSYCITIEGDKPEGLKRKRATLFEVDYALCSVCGLCLDVCPTTTLKYSKVYDQVGFERDGFVYDLLEEFRAGEQAYLDKARAEAAEEAKKKAEIAAKKKAAAAAAAKKKAEEAEAKQPRAEPDKTAAEAGSAKD